MKVRHRLEQIFVLLPGEARPDHIALIMLLMTSSAIQRIERRTCPRLDVIRCGRLLQIRPGQVREVGRKRLHVGLAERFDDRSHLLVLAMPDFE